MGWAESNLQRSQMASDNIAKGAGLKLQAGKNLQDMLMQLTGMGFQGSQNLLQREHEKALPALMEQLEANAWGPDKKVPSREPVSGPMKVGTTGATTTATTGAEGISAAAPAGAKPPVKVVSGDSPTTVAKRLGTTVDQLWVSDGNGGVWKVNVGATDGTQHVPLNGQAYAYDPTKPPIPEKKIDTMTPDWPQYPEGGASKGQMVDASGSSPYNAAVKAGITGENPWKKAIFIAPDGTEIPGDRWYAQAKEWAEAKPADPRAYNPDAKLTAGWQVKTPDYTRPPVGENPEPNVPLPEDIRRIEQPTPMSQAPKQMPVGSTATTETPQLKPPEGRMPLQRTGGGYFGKESTYEDIMAATEPGYERRKAETMNQLEIDKAQQSERYWALWRKHAEENPTWTTDQLRNQTDFDYLGHAPLPWGGSDSGGKDDSYAVFPEFGDAYFGSHAGGDLMTTFFDSDGKMFTLKKGVDPAVAKEAIAKGMLSYLQASPEGMAGKFQEADVRREVAAAKTDPAALLERINIYLDSALSAGIPITSKGDDGSAAASGAGGFIDDSVGVVLLNLIGPVQSVFQEYRNRYGIAPPTTEAMFATYVKDAGNRLAMRTAGLTSWAKYREWAIKKGVMHEEKLPY
jgi:hypothetical protein